MQKYGKGYHGECWQAAPLLANSLKKAKRSTDIAVRPEPVEGRNVRETERPDNQMAFWVYVLNVPTALTTPGIRTTFRLESRNTRGAIAGYTSSRLPVTLVFLSVFSSAKKHLLASSKSKVGVERRKRQ